MGAEMTNELAEWAVGDPMMLYFASGFFCFSWLVLALGLAVIRSDVEWFMKVLAMPPILAMATALSYAALSMLSNFTGYYIWPLPL